MQAAIQVNWTTARASPEQMAAVERPDWWKSGNWEMGNRNGRGWKGVKGLQEILPVLPGNALCPDASWSGLEPGLEREKGELWSPRA